MNGDGKSDRLVVPMRPTNKDAGAPASAESVEGRGLAKGNAGQQNRHRAPLSASTEVSGNLRHSDHVR